MLVFWVQIYRCIVITQLNIAGCLVFSDFKWFKYNMQWYVSWTYANVE